MNDGIDEFRDRNAERPPATGRRRPRGPSEYRRHARSVGGGDAENRHAAGGG